MGALGSINFGDIGALPITTNETMNYTPSQTMTNYAPLPSTSSSGSGFLSNIGDVVNSFGNLGLEIGAAVTRGFSSPVITPQPQYSATPGILATTGAKDTFILLLAVLGIAAIFVFKKKR